MNKKKARNLRVKARRYFDKLLKLNNYKCYYCDQLILRPKNVKNIIEVNKDFVLYVDEGIHLRRTATVEHIVRIADGGTSVRENLTVSCRLCNVSRATKPFGKVKIIPRIFNGYATNMNEYEFNFFFWVLDNMKVEVIKEECGDRLIKTGKKLFLLKKEEVLNLR
jgi:5-methylcytosine-specific restriction endonuclease McrA